MTFLNEVEKRERKKEKKFSVSLKHPTRGGLFSSKKCHREILAGGVKTLHGLNKTEEEEK
jgi:hypothetical protein